MQLVFLKCISHKNKQISSLVLHTNLALAEMREDFFILVCSEGRSFSYSIVNSSLIISSLLASLELLCAQEDFPGREDRTNLQTVKTARNVLKYTLFWDQNVWEIERVVLYALT